jgi:hypothetical protein
MIRKTHWLAAAGGILALSGCGGGAGGDIAIDNDDIAGVVSSSAGPEAGIWVIAETDDLPTKFVRSVVTDDQGRYLLPDLPAANYRIFARGYGLVDSPKVEARPGVHLNLEPTIAPDEATAAKLYPSLYWFALLNIPQASEFPGTGEGEGGNGIAPAVRSQGHWIHYVKSTGCYSCHQFGSEYMRTVPAELKAQFDNSFDAWTHRVQTGQAATSMVESLPRMGATRALKEYASYTDRIEAGELPFEKPARPEGVERNVVVTQWDWSEPQFYMHDAMSTDRRNPTVNGYGKLYGTPELSTDRVPVLDPVTNTASEIRLPVRDPNTPSTKTDPQFAPSLFWGPEPYWDSQAVAHNHMMDERGRIWFASRVGPAENPAFCKAGSDHPSAKLTPIDRSGRHLTMFDPATNEWTMIRTCFDTHHLQFTEDGKQVLWFSRGGVNAAGFTIGFFDTLKYQETGDEAASQGWTTFVLDTNGNGKRDPNPVAANEPVDPTRDKIMELGNYSISIGPDGSIWGAVVPFPSGFMRVIPGDNPPETTLTQFYRMPYNDPNAPIKGHSIRGADIDRNGVMWAGVQSGHIASFDVRKCTKPLNGPEATGDHCPEGWSFIEMPGPQFKDIQDVPGSADTSYYTWVDQFNTLGLGENVPIIIGNASESLLAVVDGKVITMHPPYPMGFFAKGLDGRIDDPNAGWKGRGLWTTSGQRTPAHMETGKGTKPKVYHFQMRQSPLDK